MAERHDPLQALRQPQFLLFAISRFFGGMAMMMLSAAVFWQVYDISGSAWQLGLVGLVRFVPSFFLSLPAGAMADTHDRRRIVLGAQVIQLAGGAALAAGAIGGLESVPFIYAAVFVSAIGSAVEWPARQSLMPMVIRDDSFANAIVVSGAIQQVSFLTGPPLAGLLIAWQGVGLAYVAMAIAIAVSVFLVTILRPRASQVAKRGVSVQSVLEGVQFVWTRKVILGAMTLDMFAVIFGGAVSLLPIYAKDILHVGSLGYGFLYSSIDAGAVAMSLLLVALPQPKNTGRTLLLAVAGFGLATVVFGISRSYPLSLAACACIGMSDEVSVVMRQTTIQLSTPDALRGRVTSVNMLFIGASNQLGTVESGFVAAIAGATFAVVSGGIGCLAVLALVAMFIPEMRSFRLRAGAHAPVGELPTAVAGEATGTAGTAAGIADDAEAATPA